jgi:nucleoside-diphosphate-sugar epimerase
MEDKPDNPVLIVGCGYIGRRVARRLQAGGHAVTGLVRSAGSARELAAAGVDALVRDLDRDIPPLDAAFRVVYYFAPPPGVGGTDTRMTRVLDALAAPRRIVYISTSAVYGDCDGAWIDEDHPLRPTTARGARRLDAERQLRAWAQGHGVEWVILRVPGIYGPGKLPLARLRQGLPVLREDQAPYTNRIHGDDLAAICVAAMQSDRGDSIYNVSDGHPGNMTDYFFRVADAAGLPRPPVVSREEAASVLSAGMLSFLNDSRRLRNDKLLKELRITLQYPDLDAGLAASLGQPDETGGKTGQRL